MEEDSGIPPPAPDDADRKDADAEVASLAYRALREIAGAYMARERSGHTLQPTALVNEAYTRLMSTKGFEGVDREAFVGIASRVMRQVLVDHARGKNASKRGGGWGKVTLSGLEEIIDNATAVDVLSLDAALDRLAKQDARLSQIVELRFFAGMTMEQAAACMGVSLRTAESDWAFARAWLRRELDGGEP